MVRYKSVAKRGKSPRKTNQSRKRQRVSDEDPPTPSPRRIRNSKSMGGSPSEATTRPTSNQKRYETFKTPLHRQLYYDMYQRRPLSESRTVDFNSLDSNNANFLRIWFRRQGWDKLLEFVEPTYPDLVRQFYCHFDLANKKEGVIYTWVKGKEIKLDENVLGSILGLPRKGIHDLPGKKWSKVEGFDAMECVKMVLQNNDAETDEKPSIEALPLQTRLLHLVLFRSFDPRCGHLSSLTYLDMLVMYCVLSGMKMNMPRMMIDYMKAAQAKNTPEGFLPYGMWLTRVFRSFKVDLTDEAVSKASSPFNYLTIKNALGYYFDTDQGGWKSLEIKRAPHRDKQQQQPPRPTMRKQMGDTDEGEPGQGSSTKDPYLASVKLACLVTQEMLMSVYPNTFTEDKMAQILQKANSRLQQEDAFGVGQPDDGRQPQPSAGSTDELPPQNTDAGYESGAKYFSD